MTSPPRRPRSTIHVPLHFVRGFLIGLAELVPGISGGTVALVTGVYEHLIDAASHVLAALRRLLCGPQRKSGFAAELRRTDWWLAIPALAGMALAVLTMAGVMEIGSASCRDGVWVSSQRAAGARERVAS